jgi:hypothetical protein
MRWRTANNRRRRKLHGPRLRQAVINRVALCNRFAASDEGRLAEVRFDGHREWFKTVFYALKDRLMDRYGKPKGYAHQIWHSRAYEGRYDYDGYKDGAEHHHILERVKLGKLMLHRPTGHFAYRNTLNGYYKESEGYDLVRALCVETINGKKRVTRNVPSASDARAALAWLMRRYGRLVEMPEKPKPRPRVKTGNSEDDWMRAQLRREKAERAAEAREGGARREGNRVSLLLEDEAWFGDGGH